MEVRRLWGDRFAFAVSAAASPFLTIPAFMIVLTLGFAPLGSPQFFRWLGIALGCSVALPGAYILAQVLRGRISDVHVGERAQRSRPYLVALAGGVIGTIWLWRIGAPVPLVALGACMFANGLIFAVVSRWWKISVHSSVLSAGAVASYEVYGWHPWLWLPLAAVPVVIWARSRRGRHSPAQGIVAVVVSIVVTLAVFRLLGT